VRGGSASDRFDYLYSEEELAEWIDPLRELASGADQAYVLFNNNRWSGRGSAVEAQAPKNAQMLRQLLRDAGLPVS
jgi:uncharacterized protein YecE (DUF72 family)